MMLNTILRSKQNSVLFCDTKRGSFEISVEGDIIKVESARTQIYHI